MTHGYSGYKNGCRCLACRGANSSHKNRIRIIRKETGGGLVSPERAIRHLCWLSVAGVGVPTITARTGLAACNLHRIKLGRSPKIRKSTEIQILAIRPSDGRRVDAAPVREKVNRLLAEGFTQSEIQRRMGYRPGGITWLRRKMVSEHTARKVEAFYNMIMAGA